MHVVEATDNLKEDWDAFVAAAPTGSFLQSWAWGEFQRAAGFPVTRLAVVEETLHSQLSTFNSVQAVCLLVRRPLPLGRWYLYAPWGPVFRGARVAPAEAQDDTATVADALTDELRRRLAGGGVFARIEPKLPAGGPIPAVLERHGYLVTGRGVQPKDTLVLDLAQTEDELLVGMHPKWRYNIRLARRHGVRVVEQTDATGLQTFLRLAAGVQHRREFHYHPEKYYAAMLRTLLPARMLTVLIAEHEGEPLAAHLLVRFSNSVTYAHGASSTAKRHVMAPHLLQWEGVLRAKAAGATRYDFFGIAPPGGGVQHAWFGVTRFKRGFGGAEEHFVGAADLVGDSAFYRAYEAGRTLRALLR